MGVRLLVPEIAAAHAALVYSPALEAVLSLHILVEPRHHPLHHQWVRAARRRLSADMRRLIAGFRFAHATPLPSVLLPSASGQHPGFEQELRRLDDLGPALGDAILAYFLGLPADGRQGACTDPERRASLVQRMADFPGPTRELVRVGLESPLELAGRFLEFLTRYWEEVGFRQEWERIEPKLADTVTHAGRDIAEQGLYTWLQRLGHRVRVDAAAGSLRVGREVREDIVVTEDDRLVLALSGFLWPHVGLVHDPPRAVGLGHSAPFAMHTSSSRAARGDSTSLLELLRVLSDPMRLRALQLIAESPRSTQELAPLLGISQAALSKQLRRLTEAGVLQPRREGYYVVYSLVTGRIARLSSDLLAILGAVEPAPYRGDYAETDAQYRRSRTILEELGDRDRLATAMGKMGELLNETRRPKEAVAHTLASLSTHLELHSPDIRADFSWLSRQRVLLGDARFRELVGQHLDATSTSTLLELLDQEEWSPPST
jgi:DNA-binding transcriptional ArsR family regulator